MRIAILNKKGIDKIIDEILQDLPINQRFVRVDGKYETLPYKVQIMPNHNSYSQDINGTAKIISLIGPYEDVPNFAIASSEEERKKMLKESDNNPAGHRQNHLIVLDNDIFFRQLELDGYSKNIRVRNVEGIHLNNGYCYSRNKESYSIGEYKKEKNSLIWDHIVKDMVKYFINYDCDLYPEKISNKVIFGSERSRDKVAEIFNRSGLKPTK